MARVVAQTTVTNLFDESKSIQCGMPEIEIDGFRPISNEVVFLDCLHEDDDFEPLLGYVILEQAQAAVDMLGHRLVPVRYIDMKQAGTAGVATPVVKAGAPCAASGCP